jgi:hypothetical protein
MSTAGIRPEPTTAVIEAQHYARLTPNPRAAYLVWHRRRMLANSALPWERGEPFWLIAGRR